MVPVLVGGAESKRGAGGEAMNKKDIYFCVLGKCLTVIMRLLWSRLIRSNRQGVIVVSLVSLTWQLLYKVSALQSRKRGVSKLSGEQKLLPHTKRGSHLLSCVWSSGAAGFPDCLVLH